jgi:hypothetical protein
MESLLWELILVVPVKTPELGGSTARYRSWSR